LPKLSYVLQDYDSFYSEKPNGRYYLKKPAKIIPLKTIGISEMIDAEKFNGLSAKSKFKRIREFIKMITYLYKPDFKGAFQIVAGRC
jgi:hypothetical protein